MKSRRAFPRPKVLRWGHRDGASAKDIDDLSRLVARIEPDAKGVPVLLRQYLKLGGRLLGFHSDPEFSDVLDGLMRVDLRNADARALSRCMGQEGARAFLAHHAASLRRAS